MEQNWIYSIKNLINSTESNKSEEELEKANLTNLLQQQKQQLDKRNNANSNYLTDNDDDCASTISRSSRILLPKNNSFLMPQNYNQNNQNQQETTFQKLNQDNNNNSADYYKQQQPFFTNRTDSLKFSNSKNYNFKKNQQNYRNYHSAAEDDEDTESAFPFKIDNSNYNNISRNQISNASITLRQPLKDVNYFSDSEKSYNKKKNSFSIRNNKSNYNNNNNSARFSANSFTKNPTNCFSSNLDLDNNSPNVYRRSNTQLNNNKNDFTFFKEVYNNNNNTHNHNGISNRNNTQQKDIFKENEQNILNSILEPRNKNMVSFQQQYQNPADQRQAYHNPHGFSKLSPFNRTNEDSNTEQYQQQSMPQQPLYSSVNFQNKVIHQATPKPYTPYNYWSANPAFGGSGANANLNNQAQQSYQNYGENEQRQEKYEREMGKDLKKPSTQDSNYSDSYFYNSSTHNYPTINDQKRLAKTIADTLEGSNPTSKYHKKKQVMRNQLGFGSNSEYESDNHHSDEAHRYNNYDTQEYNKEADAEFYVNPSVMYDESVPDVIKRSIMQAAMSDPVRMVQAPESFKEQHYTEHNSHTQMNPKLAMSLASALQNDIGKGGRGAELFQKRKARSERWVVTEKGNQQPTPPQTPQFQLPNQNFALPLVIRDTETPKVNDYKLNQDNNNMNDNRYSDFNTTPRGWGSNNFSPQIKPIQQVAVPNKLNLNQFTAPRNYQNENPQTSTYEMSKDGIENLKSKFYASATKPSSTYNPLPFYKNAGNENENQMNFGGNTFSDNKHPQISKVKLNKLSSQENYLFNSKNNPNFNNNNNQSYDEYNSRLNYEDSIATSDL